VFSKTDAKMFMTPPSYMDVTASPNAAISQRVNDVSFKASVPVRRIQPRAAAAIEFEILPLLEARKCAC
jgi:hypothetical protein